MPTKKTTTKEKKSDKKENINTEVAAAAEIDAADTAVLETGDIEKATTAAPLKKGRLALVKKMQTHKNDTGSTEVQIALLTSRINDLVKHLKEHGKDNDSRQGLLRMVGRRRRLLRFLKNSSEQKYADLVAELKLRK